MPRLSVLVERHQAFGRRLEQTLINLKVELNSRLQAIEQDQFRLLNLYFADDSENCGDLVKHLKKKYAKLKHCDSMTEHFGDDEGTPRVSRTLQLAIARSNGERETNDSPDRTEDVLGSSLERLTLSAKRTVKPREHHHTVASCYSSSPSTERRKFQISKSWTKPNLYKKSGQQGNSDSQQPRLPRSASFATPRASPVLEKKEFGGNTLTAFAFSKYRDQSPHVRRSHDLPASRSQDLETGDTLKSRIRTKVVKNYLLTDVFKRLNKTKMGVPRRSQSMTTEERHRCIEEGHQCTMEELKHCRYLRMPKSTFHKMEETSETDISKIDIK